MTLGKPTLIIIMAALILSLFAISAHTENKSTPRVDGPAITDPSSPLSIDHIIGEFTFSQSRPNTFINGYIKFDPDHTFTLVAHFDNNRDRITDNYEIIRGVYKVRLTEKGPMILISQEGEKSEWVTETVFMDGKIKSFSLKGFAFARRVEGGLYFDHTLNVPTTAKALKVSTTPPGAIVFLEGVRVEGNTPLVIHNPPAGRPINIRVELVDHSTKTEAVELAVNETRSLSYALVSGEAELWIATEPWTKVIIDDKYFGNAPIKIDNLRAGTHKVRLINTGAEIDDIFEVELPEGGLVKKIFKYKGKLNIFVGRDAEIVDRKGKVIGKAPMEGLDLPVGNHTLRLVDAKTKEMKIIVIKIGLDKTTTFNQRWQDLKSWKD